MHSQYVVNSCLWIEMKYFRSVLVWYGCSLSDWCFLNLSYYVRLLAWNAGFGYLHMVTSLCVCLLVCMWLLCWCWVGVCNNRGYSKTESSHETERNTSRSRGTRDIVARSACGEVSLWLSSHQRLCTHIKLVQYTTEGSAQLDNSCIIKQCLALWGGGWGRRVCVDESQAEEDEVLLWLEFPSRPMLVTWASVWCDGVLLVVVPPIPPPHPFPHTLSDTAFSPIQVNQRICQKKFS